MVMHDNGFKQKKNETKDKNGPQHIQIVWSTTGKVTFKNFTRSLLNPVSTVNSCYHRGPVTEGQENTSIGRLTLPCVKEFQAHSSSATLTTAYIVSCLMFIHSIKILNAQEELQSA